MPLRSRSLRNRSKIRFPFSQNCLAWSRVRRFIEVLISSKL
ncbi:MAG: hypothetical protein JWM16_5427, partial [Verrucomicrobiales bacterium]|nr:hypothetical protein [Verrucomicrobiales bacterium]